MSGIKLGKCPYCGGRAEWDVEQTVCAGAAAVYCTACGAATREYTPHEAAGRAWNAGLVFSRENAYRATFSRVVIVSRHAGTIEWLKSHGITGDVIAHVSDPVQIVGKIVVGALPLHLAAQALAVASIDMPDLPADRRGQELTPAEMDAYGARLSVYRVTRG